MDSLTESDGGDSIILGWQGAATVFNINLFIFNLHIIIYDNIDCIILGWQGAATVFNINLFILDLDIIILLFMII